MTSLYKDEYEDLWQHISPTHIKRMRDGNIGGFFNGQGLTRY